VIFEKQALNNPIDRMKGSLVGRGLPRGLSTIYEERMTHHETGIRTAGHQLCINLAKTDRIGKDVLTIVFRCSALDNSENHTRGHYDNPALTHNLT
jgi:hypothetical protein